MSNRYYVGKQIASLTRSPAYLPYSKVVVIVGDDDDGKQIAYEAGDDSGKTLEVTNPWGTQEIANHILSLIRGYTYTPFEAQDAFVSDDAELGDAVTVSGIYGALVSQDITFDGIGVSTLSAPGADETDNEFGNYTPSHER